MLQKTMLVALVSPAAAQFAVPFEHSPPMHDTAIEHDLCRPTDQVRVGPP